MTENNYSKASRPNSLNCESKVGFPYNLEGTVSMDGNITNFVTENLEYKIKIASPIAKKGKPDFRSKSTEYKFVTRRFNILPSFSGYTPSDLNTNILNNIEVEAQYLAASVDSLTENLGNLLHSISSITADNVETYKNSVNKLTDCMDGNIKSMYTIMAKTEEISNLLKPTEHIANRIRELKRLTDALE